MTPPRPIAIFQNELAGSARTARVQEAVTLARERLGETTATRVGAGLLSAILGLGNVGDSLLGMGAQLLTLKFSREDESEADLVGMDLSARAGYDPRAGVSLWQKMGAQNKGAPPQFLSTHPSDATRVQKLQQLMPEAMKYYTPGKA